LRDTPTSNTGTCGAYPKRGEPCIDDVFACDDVRDACDPVTSKCIARLAVGADCSSFNGCVAYAYCDQTTEKCVKKVGAGQPCTSDGNCLGGLDCDPAEGKCVERPPQIVCP
jgi:hypothetical protein